MCLLLLKLGRWVGVDRVLLDRLVTARFEHQGMGLENQLRCWEERSTLYSRMYVLVCDASLSYHVQPAEVYSSYSSIFFRPDPWRCGIFHDCRC